MYLNKKPTNLWDRTIFTKKLVKYYSLQNQININLCYLISECYWKISLFSQGLCFEIFVVQYVCRIDVI